VDVQQLSDTERKKLPRYPVLCFRMGRLAPHSAQAGNGLGEVLMGCAFDRCLLASSLVGAYALLVDAKDDKAKAFYLHYGFTACTDAPLTLYLPLG
jgi:predicted GNAT family N-acyltransferase